MLEQLVATKLERAAAKVRKEGWSWVEIHPEFGYEERATFRVLEPVAVPLSSDLQDEDERLAAEEAALEELADALNAEQEERLAEIATRRREIDDAQEFSWPESLLQLAGAVVTIGSDGKTDIMRGLPHRRHAPQAEHIRITRFTRERPVPLQIGTERHQRAQPLVAAAH